MAVLERNLFEDKDLAEIDQALQLLQEPFDPLDVSALDGFLVGVLLQPAPPAIEAWWPLVVDEDRRCSPAQLSTPALLALRAKVEARHHHLAQSVSRRQWFDPWVFELGDDASVSECVLPWVAGFAAAMHHFPALMDTDSEATLEPLAMIFVHLDPEDLDDADDLLEAMAELEPASTLDQAVEDLVTATLLLADVSHPQPTAVRAQAGGRAGRPAHGPRRPSTPQGRRR
jgi:uncharacterized protein